MTVDAADGPPSGTTSLPMAACGMLTEITARRDEIAAICRRHHVRRLELLGSAARVVNFDPTRSDIDFLVEFQTDRTPALAGFFALRQELSNLLGYPVDLVSPAALRNPYRRASIDATRMVVFSA